MGGDFYRVVRLDENRYAAAIADDLTLVRFTRPEDRSARGEAAGLP